MGWRSALLFGLTTGREFYLLSTRASVCFPPPPPPPRPSCVYWRTTERKRGERKAGKGGRADEGTRILDVEFLLWFVERAAVCAAYKRYGLVLLFCKSFGCLVL